MMIWSRTISGKDCKPADRTDEISDSRFQIPNVVIDQILDTSTFIDHVLGTLHRSGSCQVHNSSSRSKWTFRLFEFEILNNLEY